LKMLGLLDAGVVPDCGSWKIWVYRYEPASGVS